MNYETLAKIYPIEIKMVSSFCKRGEKENTKNAGKSQDVNENKQLKIDILASPRMLMKTKLDTRTIPGC